MFFPNLQVGQQIALVLAKERNIAMRAANIISKSCVNYTKSLPAVVSLKEAINQNSFMKVLTPIIKGDVNAVFNDKSNVTVEGDMFVGGQEHFYLETHSCVAYPFERERMVIYSSTQDPSHVQVRFINAEIFDNSNSCLLIITYSL